MSMLAMFGHMLLERFSAREPLPRVPEPELVMQSEESVAGYAGAGQARGVLAGQQFFHAVQASLCMPDAGRVLDLACGPATLLMQVASINPHCEFIGVDLSERMLAQARQGVHERALTNLAFQTADATRLDGIATGSVDAVMCTFSLHHLPDLSALQRLMREAQRVLKPGGGAYFVDFGRLKRESTQRYFINDRRAEQGEAFTLDFWHSLRAAFSQQELAEASRCLGEKLVWSQTAIAPFIVMGRHALRADWSPAQREAILQLWNSTLNRSQRADARAMASWFGTHALPPKPAPIEALSPPPQTHSRSGGGRQGTAR